MFTRARTIVVDARPYMNYKTFYLSSGILIGGTVTVVGLRLSNRWEYHPPTHTHPPTPPPPHKLKTT